MAKVVLKCQNLCKSFGKKQILKNVSFELEEGDILGFIGPNGAGKTTTIKLILGLQKINSGSVIINGFDVKKDFTKAIERVGTIVENPDLYMYLTGYQNLKLMKNIYKNVDETRIEEVIKLVGLENRINDKVSKYSLGMRQRLGIAQAVLHKPNILILDEPNNGLDPEGIKQIRELLKKLSRDEKMSILISSHNLAELESLCNKVCIIKNGTIVEENNITTLKKSTVNHSSYIFETNSAQKASKIIKEKSEIIDNIHIRVYIEKSYIPSIIKELLEDNLLVYTIQEEELSLEDAFLKKTGGNVID